MEKRVKLLGYDIDTFNFDDALDYAKNLNGQIVTINPEMMSNPKMQGIVNSSELIIPDGIGVQLGLLIKGYKIKRIPGIQFAYKLLEECAKTNQSVALIGAKPQILEQTVKNLKNNIKNINIVYCQDGYFTDDNTVIQELVNHNPRLVLCALGSPKQEIFINNAKTLLKNSIFIGVGGSFDVWSGVVKRAPEIWQKLGLEWLYRTIKEPERFKRIFPTLPLFVLRVFNEKFRGN